MEDAVNRAYNAGVVLVAAAGNSNTSAATYPSDYNNVISVISVDNPGAKPWIIGSNPRSSFSDFGWAKNISAPGTAIMSTLPSGGYGIMDGTSMASPVVAAVAAMVLYANPALTNAEVANILEQTATDVHATGRDDQTGWGVVQADRAVLVSLGKFHTVTFSGNDGSPATQTRLVVEWETTVGTLPPAPTRASHSFTGWNTAADGTGTAFTASTPVTENITVYAQWQRINTDSSSGGGGSRRGGGGGGGGAAPPPAPVVPAPATLEQGAVITLASGAKAKSQDFARTRHTGEQSVRAGAWAGLAGLRYEHDSIADSSLQVRLYIDNPERFTKDAKVSAWLTGDSADKTKAFFGRWYSNKLKVISFDQKTDWEHPVRVAAKIDLTGMDSAKLVFYSYERASNTFRRIQSPAYRVDTNGFLHLTTPLAGEIVISEGLLARKG